MSQRHARIQSLDALRGFALLGILAVNIQLFAGWGYLGPDARDALSSSGLDAHLKVLIDVLAQGKFYSLFSLLFGYSFVMLAGKVGAGAAGQHLRRMLGLLVVGIAHAVLFWPWDILYLYAVVGCLLTPFLHRSALTLLAWAGVLLLAVFAWQWTWQVHEFPLPWSNSAVALLQDNVPQLASGSYAEVVRANVGLSLATVLDRLQELRPVRVLALFLIGAAAARLRLAEADSGYTVLLHVCAWAGLSIAIGLSVAEQQMAADGPGRWVRLVAGVAAGPAMGIAYAALLLLWWRRAGPIGRAARNALAPAGRMALTNYIAQSVVCIVVFYGFGLGLFAARSLAWLLMFTGALFLLQLLVSWWWLEHFRQGPLEWLWRWQVTGARPLLLRAP